MTSARHDMRTRTAILMKRTAIAALALLLTAAAALPAALDPATGFILPADHARELLSQCSRNTPQGVQGTWLPDAGQIRALEAALPQALARARGPDRQQVQPGYGRQYGGIVIGGRKLIYVNAFPMSVIDFYRSSVAVITKKAHREAVVICDGGPDFFGAVYDPLSRTFRDFAFNGFA